MKWRSAVVLGAKVSWGRCCCWIVLVASALAQERRYSTKYDNIDIDTVVKNERLVTSYVGCLLDKRPCTPDAAELKSTFIFNVFILLLLKFILLYRSYSFIFSFMSIFIYQIRLKLWT